MIRFFPRNDSKRCAAIGAAALAVGVALMATGAAIAQSTMQGVPNAMQGFSQNRDQPIQIEAASLEMRDKKKEATFAGNVKVIQGDTTMTSKTLVVFYDSGGDKHGSAEDCAPLAVVARKKSDHENHFELADLFWGVRGFACGTGSSGGAG